MIKNIIEVLKDLPNILKKQQLIYIGKKGSTARYLDF